MNKRRYLYIVVGVLAIVALAIGSIVVLNQYNPRDKQANSTKESSTATDDSSKSATSDTNKTPTDTSDLTKTLNNDATSIEDELKNNENSDYDDSNLTDSSLYN